MFVSVLAFAAAAAASPQASAPAPSTTAPATAAPAAKPRKICRTETLIGSITPKRVCTIVAPRDADAQKAPSPAASPSAATADSSAER